MIPPIIRAAQAIEQWMPPPQKAALFALFCTAASKGALYLFPPKGGGERTFTIIASWAFTSIVFPLISKAIGQLNQPRLVRAIERVQ